MHFDHSKDRGEIRRDAEEIDFLRRLAFLLTQEGEGGEWARRFFCDELNGAESQEAGRTFLRQDGGAAAVKR